MNYTDLVTNLTTLLTVPASDTSFQAILPALINDAEQRIYRELDFLYTVFQTSPTAFTPNNRAITAPATTIIVQGLAAVTPASTQPAAGTRNQLERVSLDFLDTVWPVAATTGLPVYYALLTDTSVVVAPTPDQAYVAEWTGTFRPAPMSASNATTWLGDHLPDLFLAACMVFGSAYLRDWSSMSDDPKLALSWETHYQTLKASAVEEEQRRKSQGTNWTPMSETPLSAPRG